jgi:hypothetical protein
MFLTRTDAIADKIVEEVKKQIATVSKPWTLDTTA